MAGLMPGIMTYTALRSKGAVAMPADVVIPKAYHQQCLRIEESTRCLRSRASVQLSFPDSSTGVGGSGSWMAVPVLENAWVRPRFQGFEDFQVEALPTMTRFLALRTQLAKP
jgi:hypothetical protein